jgi:hypothetical protein
MELNYYKVLRKVSKSSFTNRQRSRCQVGTFLYVSRAVTSNIIIAHWPWILQYKYDGLKAIDSK